ncbi:hypothetical protein [Spirosoma foliorum]|uniref:Uncharacterized protein n=1 Tax=Spirosoma foliorum TaxID=2710596 RepID=A0A7G5GZ73_9BACT|nr:hypothetical protein [Spirosoma foliorum]QMW04165.1 hypothetical protein H3H32_04190 [Spirosoma foliorum]
MISPVVLLTVTMFMLWLIGAMIALIMLESKAVRNPFVLMGWPTIQMMLIKSLGSWITVFALVIEEWNRTE